MNEIESPTILKESPEASTESRDISFQTFVDQFQQLSLPEERLQYAIHFMEKMLSQAGGPHFRSFWEARHLSLPLFKENLAPTLRSQFWDRYSELSREARRVKDLLNEQNAFAAEQIEIAIEALETDLKRLQEQAIDSGGNRWAGSSFPDDVVLPQDLQTKSLHYAQMQCELNFLNAYAARINALRKELLKTQLRIKQKNKFFQRLSGVGNDVFPRRKELIQQVSGDFIADVDRFIESHFKGGTFQDALYFLREEIKLWQRLSKVLTLNTQAFTQTRALLSQCWDKIKEEERERKKERAEQREACKQSFDLIQEPLEKPKQADIIKERVEKLIEESERLDVETLSERRDALLSEAATWAKGKRQEVERPLKLLSDIIADKREKALLNLSEDDRQTLGHLKDILQQRKERKQEIKDRLETLRKAVGSSSLDFEKAMLYNAQIGEERERLEKVNGGIEEIEGKIAEVKVKLRK